MSKRRRTPPPIEPVAPVPPQKQQSGHLSKRRKWDSFEMARWWRQRDNAAKRKKKE